MTRLDDASATPPRRRVPAWVLILAGVLLVGGCAIYAVGRWMESKAVEREERDRQALEAAKSDAPTAVPVEPPPRVRPVKLTAEDRKAALPREYPDRIRGGLTDEQLAEDLNLRAYAFDFTGGPVRFWIEVEEQGQSTLPSRKPRTADAGSTWKCPTDKGHAVFGVGRGASVRMKKLMQAIGKDAFPESIGFDLQVSNPEGGWSSSFGESHGDAPLWFSWTEKTTFTDETPTLKTVPDGEPVTVLAITAEETAADKDGKRRKATLTLKAQFGKWKE